MKNNALFKAKKLIADEGVFKITDTPNYEYWIVKGTKKDSYEIIYNKITETNTCTCKNIRLTDCSHILAVKLIKGELENENQGINMEPILQE